MSTDDEKRALPTFVPLLTDGLALLLSDGLAALEMLAKCPETGELIRVVMNGEFLAVLLRDLVMFRKAVQP